jgi:pimeloyl-ACP methyl ester carboxylesterase
MVPPAHGRWLGEHVPGARMHFLEDQGHVSMLGNFELVVAELVEHAWLL